MDPRGIEVEDDMVLLANECTFLPLNILVSFYHKFPGCSNDAFGGRGPARPTDHTQPIYLQGPLRLFIEKKVPGKV